MSKKGSKRLEAADTFVLDVEPRCKCGNVATVFLEVHNVDRCAEEPTKGSFLCQTHLSMSMASLDRLCDLGGETCVICGLCIVNPSDMIVRLCPTKRE